MAETIETPQQVIRPTVVDHMLEPDALRGSEHVLQNVRDSNGERIEILDMEKARGERQLEAVRSRAPMSVASSSSMTPAEQITPSTAGIPADIVLDRAPATWEQQASAAGWAPRSDTPMSPYAERRTSPGQLTPQQEERLARASEPPRLEREPDNAAQYSYDPTPAPNPTPHPLDVPPPAESAK